MSYFQDELFKIADELKEVFKNFEEQNFDQVFNKLQEASTEVEESFCGSWIGYHSKVYYRGFNSPPAGARFSKEWGLMNQHFGQDTTGEWVEYKKDDVIDRIYSIADDPSLENFREESSNAREVYDEKKEKFLSVITQYLQENDDAFINKQKNKVEEIKNFNQSDFIEYFQPKGKFFTRDSTAMGQGMKVPPHIIVKSDVLGLKHPYECLKKLEKISRRAASHLAKKERKQKPSEEIGTNVFIGHGRSLIWKNLKDFIQDKLKLPWDEFNRKPVAGITNISRLSQMLDDAAIAFIIMTAEDEQADGKLRARMNVIHEAGLFQGRLGFTKSIILLEEGCEEFSNIEGLGQIRFPEGNIKAAFEEVREVLQREDII